MAVDAREMHPHAISSWDYISYMNGNAIIFFKHEFQKPEMFSGRGLEDVYANKLSQLGLTPCDLGMSNGVLG